MRKIHEVSGMNGIAKVYRDSKWNEYRVTFSDSQGKKFEGADYHTDEKADAISTANLWVKSDSLAQSLALAFGT